MVEFFGSTVWRQKALYSVSLSLEYLRQCIRVFFKQLSFQTSQISLLLWALASQLAGREIPFHFQSPSSQTWDVLFKFEMRSIKSEAGFFGNFLSFFVLFLSTTNLVLSVPVTIQARGGPSICGLPLKASNYRQTCLGNPQTGILAQAGLASSVGASGLVWQSSQRMSQTMQYLTSRKEASSVHCDQ